MPDGDDERSVRRLRLVATAVLVAGLVACAGEAGSGPSDPSLLPPGATQGSVTTVDVDGRQPDAVEPPAAGGLPDTAVPVASTTRTPLPGFGEVVVEVRRVGGDIVEWCLLLAETPEQTQRGLMEVTDPELAGYAGMLFRFDAPRDGGFYMRNTPQPLSIVYLDGDGGVVSIVRMEPCDDVDGCPTYPAGGAFVRAIEVPEAAGGVAALGIEPGAVVVDTGRVCA